LLGGLRAGGAGVREALTCSTAWRPHLPFPAAREGRDGKLDLAFVPAKRQRVNAGEFGLSTLEFVGATAREAR